MNTETEAAVRDFQGKPGDRAEAAKKLLSELKPGRAMAEVEAMLGAPTGKVWDYPLFYSSSLSVRFGPAWKVLRIASDLADEAQGTGDNKDSAEIREASAQFQRQRYMRQDAARKLIPFLRAGTADAEVAALLGRPSRMIWEYSLAARSEARLVVVFDESDKVTEATLVPPPGV